MCIQHFCKNSSNCRQTTKKYVPDCLMWLNRVFTDLANTDKQYCLTTDCSGVNKNGPDRYKTQAEDPDKQVCYFNKPCDDGLYNVFISNTTTAEDFSNGNYFRIEQVQGKHKIFDSEKT